MLGLWAKSMLGRLKMRPWDLYLEHPATGERLVGILDVSGWAFCRTSPICRIEVWLDDEPPLEAAIGLARPDVVAAYPADAVGQPGFKARVLLTDTGPATLSIRAIAEDGNTTSLRREFHGTAAVTVPTSRLQAPPPAFEPWMPELSAAKAALELELGRPPIALDWTKEGLTGVTFRPITIESDRLPYLDSSIDLVVTDAGNAERLAEARRVANGRVLLKTPTGLDSLWLPGAPGAPSSVSIIIPVHGHWALTRACLNRIWQTVPAGWPIEVVVVDDASPDDTHVQLQRLSASEPRLRMVGHESARGFGHACNSGAAAASGDILIFLNNDTLPEPGWLPPLLQALKNHSDAGAVGSRLVDGHGALQESEGAVFSDASAWNLGRGSHPEDPVFARLRRVDYCSAAALATPRTLFEALGGFDSRFAPAYYEDTDYCFRVRAQGREVYVQPRSSVIHLEGGTAGTDVSAGIKLHQVVNRERFAEKWAVELRAQPAPRTLTRAAQRRVAVRGGENVRRALIVAPTAAEFDRESGSRRVFELMVLLRQRGWEVSFIAHHGNGESRHARALTQLGIEAWAGPQTADRGPTTLEDPRVLLSECHYDLAILHFWHIAELYLPMLREHAPETPVVVDSIDLHFLRNSRRRFVNGNVLSSEDGVEAIRELNVYAEADRVLAVSRKEATLIDDFLARPGHTLALPLIEYLHPPPKVLKERRGLLFIGNFRHHPNLEGLRWLCREVFPRLGPSFLAEHPLTVVGNDLTSQMVREFEREVRGVQWVGWVPEIEPYLLRAQVAVVPLLTGAGTKRKLIQSLMLGTPSVTTSIGAEGLDLVPERHVLVADNASDFAVAIVRLVSDATLWSHLAAEGAAYTRAKHGPEAARVAVDQLLELRRGDSPRSKDGLTRGG
jgi:GT2 family glycosyltransferase/glycosyltransferase involved in cell wall biosynthesis